MPISTERLWLNRFVRHTPPTVRLFCFPHAGGHSIAYRRWPESLPDWVEVVSIQLPGRANRLRERPITSIEEIVAQLLPAMMPQLERPFLFFGHSMGAILAWATAHALHSSGGPAPFQLALSGRRGPRLPRREPDMSGMADPEFLAALMDRYGGIPAEIASDPEVMKLLLPAIRADIAALEKYKVPAPARLPIPIAAFGGGEDRLVPRDDLATWSDETSREFKLRQFSGGHFYLEDQRAALLADVVDLLTAGR